MPSPGRSGQPGFPLGRRRDNGAVYADAEAHFTEQLLAAAVRHEDFSDLGGTTDWKVTGRYNFTGTCLLRGAVSEDRPALLFAGLLGPGVGSRPSELRHSERWVRGANPPALRSGPGADRANLLGL